VTNRSFLRIPNFPEASPAMFRHLPNYPTVLSESFFPPFFAFLSLFFTITAKPRFNQNGSRFPGRYFRARKALNYFHYLLI
jgi:hypothetical protein